LEINGIKLDTDNSFANIIRQKKVGDVVTLKVLRDGLERSFTLKLEAAPEGL
jgi:S1-C subfamily serine protease